MRIRITGCFALLVLLLAAGRASAAPGDLAPELLARTGRTRGICAVIGGDGNLARAITERSEFLVYARGADAANVAPIVRWAAEANVLNRRLYVDYGRCGTVPFADNYVDLLIVEKSWAIPEAEMLRATCPGGMALVLDGSEVVSERVKAIPDGVDDWSHWYHTPDNNPVSTDTVLRWPYLTQWMDKPYAGAQPRTTVVAAGRLFSATGAAGGQDPEGPRARNRHLLEARNAYNGTILWQRKLDENYPTSRSAFVAAAETLYMIDGPAVLCLDAATGAERKRIGFDGAGGHLKWIAVAGGTLFAMRGEADRPWGDIKYALKYKYPVPPVNRRLEKLWGFGNEIAAYDLERGRTLWLHRERDLIDARKLGVRDGKVFFCGEERAGCLQAHSGELLWVNDSPALKKALAEVVMGYYQAEGDPNSLGSTRPGMLCTPGVVYVRTQHMANMVALSARDGRLLWAKGAVKRSAIGQHPFWLDGRLHFRNATVDPLTGDTVGQFRSYASGCGPVTVSPTGFYSRHSISFDRLRGKPVYDHSFRSGCWQDAIPAAGLLISVPYTCGCNYQLSGYVVLAPAGDIPFSRPTDPDEALTTTADLGPQETLPVDGRDWPTYRADNARSMSSPATISDAPERRWLFVPGAGFEPTAPVAAGGLIFVAGDDGRVLCVDGDSGTLEWRFTTAGKVFAAPTVAGGRVYVGSSDGAIYALGATTGRLLWRFRTGPTERRMWAFGHLVSTWPVNSGVLVHDAVAYAASGIVDRDGTYVYALDATTGTVKWQNAESGHLDKENHKGMSANGHLALGRGKLWLASGITASPAAYDVATGKCTPPSYFSVGRLNGTAGKGSGPRGSEVGVFVDRFVVYGGRMLYSDQHYRPNMTKGMRFAFNELDAAGTLVFPEILLTKAAILAPAWDDRALVTAMDVANTLECWDVPATAERLTAMRKDYRPVAKLFGQALVDPVGRSRSLPDHPMRLWRTDKIEMYAFALAGNAVVVLCGDGDLTQYVPVHNKSWSIKALSRNDGEVLWERRLPGEPLLNGLCIDRNGSVIVCLLDGRIMCFGVPADG